MPVHTRLTRGGFTLGAAALIVGVGEAEASHVAYLTSLAGRSALRDALPRTLDQELATERLAPFWN